MTTATETTVASFFGKPKYGRNTGWKNWYLEDGDNFYRIAPPVKSLAQKGIWAVFYKTHWGYGVVDNEKPDKVSYRPFECTYEENYHTKMVQQDCAECDLIEKKREELKNAQKSYASQGQSEDQIEAYTGVLVNWLKQHNLDRKWHLFAKNARGEWGVLHIPHRGCKTALDTLISKHEKQGTDLLDPEHGVWFNFNRSGKKINTTYTVEIVTQTEIINGRQMMSHKEAPLTADDITHIQNDLPDLATLNDNKRITPEQIERIVKSGGASEAVAAVFNTTVEGKADGAQSVQTTETVQPQGIETKAEPKAETKPETQPTAAPNPADDLIATLQIQLAKAMADKAKAVTTTSPVAGTVNTVTAPNPTVPEAAVSLADKMKLSTTDFLKFFPDPNKKA